MRQYARQIDQALRPLINGTDLLLVLAATEPIAMYRSVAGYLHLLAASIRGNPEAVSDAALAESARRRLDDLYGRA